MLVLLGVGNVATAVQELAVASGYDTVYGTTRQAGKIELLERRGIKPIVLDAPLSMANLTALETACENADVIASFPPSSSSDDDALSGTLRGAAKIVYVSSTGVYGGTTGIITETSQVDNDSPQSKARLEAEELWRSRGAIVLRAPALYGPKYGLHMSLRAGKFKLPGDGNRYSSRIHLDDLAAFILAALRAGKPKSLYVVGDDRPTTHREVVEWLCNKMSVEFPESIPLEEAHVTLRANRQICADKIKSELGIVLKYPSYVEGFEHCLSADA
ncbi:MAG: NAD-dependent epimerase/dehydratase family protein [Candidatus Melainabacteria bacterium]|nr:NAD-dependent epimerase/dehydratase family protein [Candidatus Melainabacteria bacterium]